MSTTLSSQPAAERLPSDLLLPLAVVAGTAFLAGCGGGGGGGGGAGGSGPGSTTLSKMAIGGTGTGTMTVNGMSAPGWSKTFTLERTTTAAGSELLKDPGPSEAEEVYDFTIVADDGAGATTAWVQVTINPAPEDLLSATDVHTRQVRLLHSRIGLGASVSDLSRFLNSGYYTMVETLITEAVAAVDHPVSSNPSWINTKILSWWEYSALSVAEREAYDNLKGPRIGELRRWWFRNLVKGSSPLFERMVLFWHNHFVTAIYDTFEPRLTWRYLMTLRNNAMGNFKSLVEEMCRDVAMCYYLNNNDNTKYGPNENFARELMELFTFGEGIVYTEADIVQVARAFTGYHVSDNGIFEFRTDLHDYGTGTPYLAYLGASATHRFGAPYEGMPADQIGNTVIDIIFSKPDPGDGAYKRVAMYIAEKLWDEFIGGTRDTATLKEIAGAFQAGWDIAKALEAVFKSTKFRDVAREGYLIRSPIEQLVGFYRTLEAEPANNNRWDDLIWMGYGGDQELGQPPNVRGWIGGTSWITAKTYLRRRSNMHGLAYWNIGRVPEYLFDALKHLMLPIAPVVEGTAIDGADNVYERLMFCSFDPAIHLK